MAGELGLKTARLPVDWHPTVHTYVNTPFPRWLAEAKAEFARLDAEEPDTEAAKDAYDMGESPATWAAYVVNS